MTRRLAPRARAVAALVAVLVVTSLASACADSQDALRVDGQTYTQQQLFADLAETSAAPGAATQGTLNPEEYPSAQVAQQLSSKVFDLLIEGELARRGIEVSAEDEDAAKAVLAQQARQSGASPDDPDTVRAAAAQTALMRDLAAQSFEEDPAAKAAAEQDLYAQVQSSLASPPEVCLHVLLAVAVEPDPTTGSLPRQATDADYAAAEAVVTAARDRIVAGEDFGAVADEVSYLATDVPGGDVGCRPVDQLVGSAEGDLLAALQSQAAGTLSEPIKAPEGYYLIRIDSRTEATVAPSLAELLADPRQGPAFEERAMLLHGRDLLTQYLTSDVAGDRVWVNPRFGSWSSEQLAVVPPDGAATPTVSTTLPDLLGGAGLGGGGAPDGSGGGVGAAPEQLP